jgi:hypothetical protein
LIFFAYVICRGQTGPLTKKIIGYQGTRASSPGKILFRLFSSPEDEGRYRIGTNLA